MTPFGVTEAILPVEPSPNQMLPSGPGVINAGLLRLGGPGVADAAVRNDPGDFATVGKREPEAAIFAHRDRERLAASTDRDAFDRRRLGSNAACREGEHGESAGKL